MESTTIIDNTAGPDKISFFGKVDRKDGHADGSVMSSYPAWCFPRHIEELKESIASDERMLERGQVPVESQPDHKADIKQRKERLDQILESMPKLTSPQMAYLEKAHAELEGRIVDARFTYDEMRYGSASAYDEMMRQKRPCIKIDPGLVQSLNLKANEDGLVSRDEAEKAWKIIGRRIGKQTSTGVLEQRKATFRTEKVEAFTGEPTNPMAAMSAMIEAMVKTQVEQTTAEQKGQGNEQNSLSRTTSETYSTILEKNQGGKRPPGRPPTNKG